MEIKPDMFMSILNQILSVSTTLGGMSVLISILAVQIVKGIAEDHWRGLRPGELWGVSFSLTLAMFYGLCLITKQDIRSLSIMGTGIMAGVGGPVAVWALRKYLGIDIDAIIGGKEDPPKPV